MKDLISFLKLALLIFFIGHYGNSTMFYHMHEVEGQMYCHSHFFGFNFDSNGIPVATHSHTANQLRLIQLFNHNLLTAKLEIPEIPAPTVRYVLQQTSYQLNNTHLPLQVHLRLRAPPAC